MLIKNICQVTYGFIKYWFLHIIYFGFWYCFLLESSFQVIGETNSSNQTFKTADRDVLKFHVCNYIVLGVPACWSVTGQENVTIKKNCGHFCYLLSIINREYKCEILIILKKLCCLNKHF